jgi:hypothetical protein
MLAEEFQAWSDGNAYLARYSTLESILFLGYISQTSEPLIMHRFALIPKVSRSKGGDAVEQ